MSLSGLPDGGLFLTVLALIISLVAPAFFAASKGYAWYCWFPGGSLLGLVVLAFLPFANAGHQEIRRRRRVRGNTIGLGLSIFALTGALASTVRFTDVFVREDGWTLWLLMKWPILAVCLVGIILAVVHWKDSRLAASLLMAASLLILANEVGGRWIWNVLMKYRYSDSFSWSWEQWERVFRSVAMGQNMIAAFSLLLLFIAVASARKNREKI